MIVYATLIGLGALILAVTALAAGTRVATLVSTGPISGNHPSESFLVDASADGSHAIISTDEQLVPEDTDLAYDIYERFGGVTTLVSAGSNDEVDATLGRVTPDGSHVFFETADALLEADTDAADDVYERSEGALRLISVGPSGGNGELDARLEGVTPDGSSVFFQTAEQLVGPDNDSNADLYRRDGNTTTRVSVGPNGGNGPHGASFLAASEDGVRAFFSTSEQLVVNDTDSASDVYERAEGQTVRVSTGPSGGNGEFNATSDAISPDGAVVLVRTQDSLLPEDTDSVQDIYERRGGETTLLTTGPEGGNGPQPAIFGDASSDAAHLFFETEEALLALDSDSETDLYERVGGTTRLVSTGPEGGDGPLGAFLGAISADGAHAYFETEESMVAADTDETNDVYERAEGTTTLISTGATGGNQKVHAFMEEASADGSHAFFETEERLTIDDVDNAKDVYVWAGGASELVSIGSSDIEVELERTSADGALTHFWTKEPLAAADGDADGDIYLSTLDTQVAAGQAPPPRPLETPRRTCLGKAATIAGTSGAETLRGTARRDVIAALGGADRVFGRGGNDLICAGSGKDLVRAGAGNDEATGGAGADRLYGDGGRDRLFGQGGRDRVFGGGGNRDLMSGGGSTDSCRDSGPSRRSGCE